MTHHAPWEVLGEEGSRQDAKDAKQRRSEPSPETDRVARAVIGAAIEVHRALGAGFLESFYEKALAIELEARGIPFQRQVTTSVIYKGVAVGEHRLDLVVDDCVIVELKAVDMLSSTHVVQVLSYLRATGLELGLLINFNTAVLKQGVRRVVWSP